MTDVKKRYYLSLLMYVIGLLVGVSALIQHSEKLFVFRLLACCFLCLIGEAICPREAIVNGGEE